MQRSPEQAPMTLPAVIALALLAMAATGCATLRVDSHAARGADLARYHTFTWSSTAPQSTGDPRLDDNPFFDARVRTDVELQLAARGFEMTPSSAPDLLVRYRVSIRQKIEVTRIDAPASQDEGERTGVYDAGAFLIDLVDPRTDQVIWRGWADGSMEGAIDRQDLMERRIDEVVTKILAQLPPRK